MIDPKDLIVDFYKGKAPVGKPFDGDVKSISCYNKLGETVLLSFVPEQALREGKEISVGSFGNSYFRSVFSRDPFVKECQELNAFHSYTERFNLGNGNLIQQIQRLLKLSVDPKPKGRLFRPSAKISKRIGIHIDGISAGRFYGNKRSIYAQNLKALQSFINNNKQYEFVQFGQGAKKDELALPSGVSLATDGNKEGLLEGVSDFLNKGIEESIDLAASCEYFICLNSSFYHIAAALECKIICIINNPKIQECYLPILVNEMPPTSPPYDIFDKIWLYPQAVHLHQDGENDLVPLFSEENLKRAINGEVYPFWSDKYLSLIY